MKVRPRQTSLARRSGHAPLGAPFLAPLRAISRVLVRPLVRALIRDRRAAEAVEFAIVAFPFLYVLLVIVQMGLYYMTQSALDAAVNNTATYYRNTWNTGALTATMPTGSALKTEFLANAGGLVTTANASLIVDLRLLTTLDSANVAITDQQVDAISGSQPIVLRAKANVITLAPGFGSLTKVQSAAILRSSAF